MAISYVSQPVQYNPYVIPFDLNLMARVLQFKETSFTQNANKIQQGINALSALPMKDEEGQNYLNNKVNSLISKVNNFGAVDLSDASITSQIDNLVNQLPDDPLISTQVAGMKQIQKVAAEYEKFRTDPKMKGNYSDANFIWFMEQANAWRSDKNSTSSYSGPTTATPFFDVNKFYHENLKNVKAQYREVIKPDGTYGYTKDGQNIITEGTLQQIVNDLTFSDPRASQQSQINAWFTAKGKTPEMIVGSLIEQTDYNITNAKGVIKMLEKELALDPNNIQLSTSIGSQIENLNSYIKDLERNKAGYTLENYQKNKSQFDYLDYQNRTARAFGNMYKVNKQTIDLKVNQAAVAEKNFQLKEQELEAYRARHGLAVVNGKLIKINTEGQLDPGSVFQKANVVDSDWTTDPDKLRVTEQGLTSQIADLNTMEAQISMETWNQMKLENPDLEGIFTKELYDELVRRGSEINPNDKTFDFGDLRFVNDLLKDGKLSQYIKQDSKFPYPLRTTEAFNKFREGIPDPTKPPSQNMNVEFASRVLNTLYDQWKTGAVSTENIGGVNFGELNLAPALHNIQNLRRKRVMFENTLKTSLNKAGLTEKEAEDYSKFLSGDMNFYSPRSSTSGSTFAGVRLPGDQATSYGPNNYIMGIQTKLKNNSSYLDEISTRIQPVGWALYDEKDLEKNPEGKKAVNSFKRQISLSVGRGEFAAEGENIFDIKNKNGVSILDSDISDINIFKTNSMIQGEQAVIKGLNTRYYALAKVKVKDGDGKDSIQTVRVPIDPKAVHSYFGNSFELPEDLELTNEEVRRFGQTQFTHHVKGGFSAEIRIVKAGNQGNSLYPPAKAQIVYKNPQLRKIQMINLFANSQGGDIFSSPATAETYAKGLLEEYIKNNPNNYSLEDFIKNYLNRK